jgi:pyruvate-formate lyase-activating enzyme
MNCAEFQSVLPYIIETGGNAEEEEHLKSCKVCGDLVADLKYIAEQAKLLVPMQDPNPRVWKGIQKSLQREGLAKAARKSILGFHAGCFLLLGLAIHLSQSL